VVAAFEEAFAAWCGVEHAVATTSGTTALDLALASLGVGPGDEVVLPTFTLVSLLGAVTRLGATPVLVDVEPDTFNVDPTAVEAATGPRTRAILAMHAYGLPFDAGALGRIAADRGVPLVEDAAEAHGATWRGRRAGTLGTLACFSFYANKIVTTGEGGMVVTGDDELAARARNLRDLDRVPGEGPYVHTSPGFNFRMPALAAALGLAQLGRADRFLARRRRTAATYERLLADVPGLWFRPRQPHAISADWMNAVLVEDGRDDLVRHLAALDIETRPFFHPLHRQPFYDGPAVDAPVAERIAATGLLLPSGNELTDADVERVANAVRSWTAP
jgi:perosamine synthetase